MQISIIGGFGKLGSKLHDRLKLASFTVHRSQDKSDNKLLAASADIVVLAIPIQSLHSVIADITQSTNKFDLVSFIAGVDSSFLEEKTDKTVTQVMCDPDFHLLAYKGTSPNALVLLQNLTSNICQVYSDKDLHAFTVLLTILFVCHQLLPAEAEIITQCKQHMRMYFSQETIANILLTNPPKKEKVLTYATKKGLTETVTRRLSKEPDISFLELYSVLIKHLLTPHRT